MNNRQTGKRKEELAGVFLNANGIRGLTYNYRCRIGEIDVMGFDGDVLVVFEVKYRSSTIKGYASEAVDVRKQYKICRVFDYYRMMKHLPESTPVRFDVLAIDGSNIDWIENAFEYIPR